MKAYQLLPVIIYLLLPSMYLRAQDDIPQPVRFISNPFAKGKWIIPFENIGKYRSSNIRLNGVEYSDMTSAGLNVEVNNFIADGWAVGGELCFNSDHEENGFDVKTTSIGGAVKLTYGQQISPSFNLMLQAHFGYESVKEKEDNGLSTVTQKWNSTKYGLTASIPTRINGNMYINPFVKVGFQNTNYEDGEQKDTDIRIGAKLMSFLSCPEMECDSKSGYTLSQNIYTKGHWFISSTVVASQLFNNYEIKYDNFPNNEQGGNITETNLNFNINFFVLDYVALGVDLDFYNDKDKIDDIDYEARWTQFKVMPMVTVHAPGDRALANLFATGGVTFGTRTWEIQTGSFNNEDKDKLSGWNVGVGYNAMFAKNLGVVPYVKYSVSTRENEDTNQERESKGVSAGLGLRFSF